MKIAFNEYFDKRISYIIEHIRNAVPKYKVWYQDEGIYKFNYIPSTFPEYTRFAYTKKPKDWCILSSEEKKKYDYFYQWNTKDINRTLVKSLKNKKLTVLQGNFIEELFIRFRDYEYEMEYIHRTNIFEGEARNDF